MKTPKPHYPLIAATVIIAGGLIPMSFGDEQQLVPIAQKATQAEADPITNLLNVEVIQPLAQMASLRSTFSRKGPTHSTSYQLVETTTKGSKGQRTFTVMQKVIPILSKTKEAKSSEYLKLRHLANSEEIQVDLKGQWVSLNEHPILKSLPKAKPTKQITP